MKIGKNGDDYPLPEWTSLWFHFDTLEFNNTSFALNVFIDSNGGYIFKLVDTLNTKEHKKWKLITEDISNKIDTNNITVALPTNNLKLSNRYNFRFFTHHTVNRNWKNNNGDHSRNKYVLKF